MKRKLYGLGLFLFVCSALWAEEFRGFVKRSDSTSSAIFQAKVEVFEGEKVFSSLKTYFDGSFKFAPNKNQTYSVKITFPGYTDTAYTVTTDKNGVLSAQNVVVKLKKDGMRLMGIVKNRDDNFPIKDVTVILKNVMSRKEERLTTDIDGRYNFKLEYETNYRVTIDKRSIGVLNKFRDTTFYIPTIGFNQPLDYKLDISLEKIPAAIKTASSGNESIKQIIRMHRENNTEKEEKQNSSQPQSLNK